MQILRINMIWHVRGIKSSNNAESMYAINLESQKSSEKSNETRISEDLPFLHIHFADLTA